MYIIPGYYQTTPDNLVSSNVSTSIAIWDAATTYVAGDLCYGADGVTVFECAVGPARNIAGAYCSQPHGEDLANVGNDPDTDPTVPAMDRDAYPDYVEIEDCYEESGRLWWIERGEYWQNEYRMFLDSPDMVTVGAAGLVSDIIVTMTRPEKFSVVALVNVKATSIRFQCPSTGADYWIDITLPEARAFPGGDTIDRGVIQLDTPVLAGNQFTITVRHDSAERLYFPTGDFVRAQCGFIFCGNLYAIGTTLEGTAAGIRDYSKKERDTFGRAVIRERPQTQLNTYRVLIDEDEVYGVQRFLIDIKATLSVFIGEINKYETVTIGYYRDLRIPLLPGQTDFVLEVEGL